MKSQSVALPYAARIESLTMNRDARGSFTEIFRSSWMEPHRLLQWDFVHCARNALRGMKVHLKHLDYLIVVRGRAAIALRDFRPSSPTFRLVSKFEASGDELQALIIPQGVGHAFWTPIESEFVLGSSRYFDPDDELSCDWSDPDLGVDWEVSQAVTSDNIGGLSVRELERRVGAESL